MNAELLLKHFDRIAEAPDAVARLRRFVLDLAVRGKLVEQDPADEPASELLKRIRLALVGRGRNAKATAAAGFAKQEEREFELPPNWLWTRLGEIAAYGVPDKVGSNAEIQDDTWVLDLEDVEKETSRLIQRATSADRPFRSAKTVFRQGDVLYGKLRPYLNKVLVADSDGVCTTEIVPIRLFAGLVPEYLKLVLQSPLTLNRIAKLMYGMKMPRLGTKDAVLLDIPLPPLPEQHRIVAKVDELMALCDELEAARGEREARRDRLVAASLHRLQTAPATADEAADAEEPALPLPAAARFHLDHLSHLVTRPEHVKQLRQAILQLAVHGRLVPQDPSEEPATELLEQAREAKGRRLQERGVRGQTRLARVMESEQVFECPPGWAWARVGDLIKLWNGYAFKSGDFQADGVPVVRIGDLQEGAVNLKSAVRVSESVAAEVGKDVWVPPGALLIAMSGATTGKVAFNDTGEYVLLNQRVGRLEPFVASVKFVRLFFETIVARNLATAFGTAIPNLSTQTINETVMALPPLAEQHRIVAKVDQLMTLCDQLEAQLATTQTDSRRLLEAVLREALQPAQAQMEVA
jgi:type I restriction enzyme S subunit